MSVCGRMLCVEVICREEMKSYEIHELRELILQILLSQGYRDEDASISTDVLLYAEIRGNNQGLLYCTIAMM